MKIYRAINAITGSTYIVDSSKDISTLYLLHTIKEIDLIIIHMVRDSRGVTYSWNKRQKIRPEFTQEDIYMRSHSHLRMAWDWFYRQLLIHLLPRKEHKYFRLRYEDLAGDPQTALDQLAEALNLTLDADKIISDQTANLSIPNHTVSGNPIRFKTGQMEIKLAV